MFNRMRYINKIVIDIVINNVNESVKLLLSTELKWTESKVITEFATVMHDITELSEHVIWLHPTLVRICSLIKNNIFFYYKAS